MTIPQTPEEYVERLHRLTNAAQVARVLGRTDRLIARDSARYGIRPDQAKPLPEVTRLSIYVGTKWGVFESVRSFRGTETLVGVFSGETFKYSAREAKEVMACPVPEAFVARYKQLAARERVAKRTDIFTRPAGNERITAYRDKYERLFTEGTSNGNG